MMRLKSDLLKLILRTSKGELDTLSRVEWLDACALTVVMASKGYPGSYQKGTPIFNADHISDAKVEQLRTEMCIERCEQVFHAGTARNADGQLISNGGRVLGITATGQTVSKAQKSAYQVI